MLTGLADLAFAVNIEFTSRGELVIPDTGSATFTLYDNLGVPVTGQIDEAISLGAADTITAINIAAGYNAIATEVEYRRVVVTYLVDGATHYVTVPYLLSEVFPYTTTKAEVRVELGLSDFELPDEDINLPEAFMALRYRCDDGLLLTGLQSGAYLAMVSNRAVALQAAVNLMPSLLLRALQARESDGSKVSRLRTMNFDKVGDKLRAELSIAIDHIDGDTASVVAVSFLGFDTDLFPEA
jgi:hypothetical protein